MSFNMISQISQPVNQKGDSQNASEVNGQAQSSLARDEGASGEVDTNQSSVSRLPSMVPDEYFVNSSLFCCDSLLIARQRPH